MDSLTAIAIVGTGQQSPEKFATGTPVDTLAAQLPVEQKERSLLLAAGAQAVYRQAGYRAQQALAMPQPAPAESRPAHAQGAIFLLDMLFKGQYTQLLPEALQRWQATKLSLPYELLPQALTYGAEHKVGREEIILVLGERGRWLSQFNPAWAWVQQFLAETSTDLPANAETIWQEGTIGQRSEILRRLRIADAAKAREWLEEVWKQEKAEARNTLLTTLEVNLSAADEPFLDTVLDDRSTTVKASAVSLLARIPGSALAKRMQERADAMIDFEKKALKKGKLVLKQPQELDEQWKRDGLDPNAAKEHKGFLQALEQIVALVPPSHWTERFATTPETLLGAVKGDTEQRALFPDAWLTATCLHRDQQWAGVLLEGQWRNAEAEKLRKLFELLPQQELEQKIARFKLDEDLAEVLNMLPRPWSQEFGSIILTNLRNYLEALKTKKNFYYNTLRILESIAIALPPTCFEQAWQLENLREEDAQHWSLTYLNDKLNEFIETLKTRKRILEEIR